jgi:LysR family glycine cleavage system transcriptional activator
MRRLPALNSLRAFELAARHRSFTRAAKDLFVTHGAVSRQIAGLEAALGVRLFERRNRSVRLTVDGEVLSRAATNAFATLEQALERIGQRKEDRPLVVSCERSLAMRWLIPRLSAFQDAYPMIKLHLSTGGGAVDFEGEFLDLAIRRADFPLNPRWQITKLFDERIGPVCAPGQLSRLRAGQLPVLHTRTRPDAWSMWLDLSGQGPSAGEERTLEHFFLTVEAAAAGLGVAIGPESIVRDDIVSGRLVAPYGFIADGTSYVLIGRPSGDTDGRESVFSDWILGVARREGLA